jgi:hypothetical protein
LATFGLGVIQVKDALIHYNFVLLHVDIQTSQKKFSSELFKIGLLFSIGSCYWDHYLVGGQSWAQGASYCASEQICSLIMFICGHTY